MDTLEQVMADLETLHPLRDKYVIAYLCGEQESLGATLAIREMHRTGWPEVAARTMMYRWPATGTRWLLDQDDPDLEFERCWDLAARPVARFHKRTRRKNFLSIDKDQEAVLAYVEDHPGLGTRALLRAGCGVEGKNPEGRIKTALRVLIAEGRIRQEPGPRNARFHYVVEGAGSGFDQTTKSTRTPSSKGGKRYATVKKRKGRKAGVWKQYQGLTIMQSRAWVLLRAVANSSFGYNFPALRDSGIVKPTVLWKYLKALEESGLVTLAKEDLTGWGERLTWVARAASLEAVAAALSAEDLPGRDLALWKGLQRLYEAQKPRRERVDLANLHLYDLPLAFAKTDRPNLCPACCPDCRALRRGANGPSHRDDYDVKGGC